MVHSLPAQFPLSVVHAHQIPRDINDTVSKLVFEDPDRLFICKLSMVQSQNSLEELLRSFISSKTAEICLLLANMQETSSKTINHIRIMIEEAELTIYQQSTKMFVLLLHFPPINLFQQCYPALFLKGWDHCYLDALAHSSEKGVVDIQDWFLKCIFPSKNPKLSDSDALLRVLQDILSQAISVLSARIYFGNKGDDSFNSEMNATQRSQALQKLLFDCGIGAVLCEKFRSYWTRKVMIEYLEKAAMFCTERESTLSVTESIQTQFSALFVDFCVYMLTHINKNFNLDIIYAEDCSPIIRRLFLDILKIFPVPKLNQLNSLSNDLPKHHPRSHSSKFPFFNFIFNLLEDQMELSVEFVNRQLDLLHDPNNASCTVSDKLHAFVPAMLQDLVSQKDVSYTA